MDRVIFTTDQGTAEHIDVSEAAKKLANKRYEIEAGVTEIFQIKDSVDVTIQPDPLAGEGRLATIKLLEVNSYTPEMGVMPLHFGPAPASGIPYASIIIEVSPNEFEKIRSNELKLPEGWSLGDPFPRPSGTGGA
jgi:hypothetical protein